MSLTPVLMPPEAAMEAPAPVLSDAASKALVGLVKECLREERKARRDEVIEARTQRYYAAGKQFIWFDRGQGIFKPASESDKVLPRYMEFYNIYAPHQRSFISQLSQSPPGINWVPNDLQQAADITAANRAEKLRTKLAREVRLKSIQSAIARLFCTDGRVGVWTRIEDGKVVCTVHGVLDLKVPLFANSIEEWDYACISRERSVAKLKRLYPNIKQYIQGSTDTGEWSYERFARLGVLGGDRSFAEAYKHLATEHTCWLRPERFEKAPDEVQDELNTFYPEGVRATVISDRLADATPEDLEKVLAVGHPSPGDGQSRPSLLHDLIPIQDAFNDGMNQAREFFDYGIPALWINGEAVDSEAIPEQRSEYGAIHTANWPLGRGAMTDAFFQEAPAVLPDGLIQFISMVSNDIAQFVISDFPTNYGAPQQDGSDTYGEAKLLSDQAKGLLGPAWQGLQQLHATFEKQAVDQQAILLQGQQVSVRNPDGTSDAFQADEVMAELYGCYPDQDASFPETMADKRAALQQVMSQIADLPKDSIAAQPDNLKLIVQMGGLKDIVIPGAVARDKALRTIEQLLNETPLPPSPEDIAAYQQAVVAAQQAPTVNPDGSPATPPQMPQQPQPQPSVQVDEDFDYLQPTWDKVQEWMASDSRVEAERQGKSLGVLNVRLYGLMVKAAIAKQVQQQATQPSKPISWSANIEDIAPDVQAALLQREGLPGSAESQQEHQGAQDARQVMHRVIK